MMSATIILYNNWFMYHFIIVSPAPKLSLFEAISLTNHSLRVQWILEYTGGSSDLYMSIDVRSHEVKRRRRSIDSSDPVAMTFEVSVEDGMLLTPSLPFGRSYEIQGMITNQYGMAIHTVTGIMHNYSV